MREFELHPVNPQERLVNQIVEVLNQGGTIALPTDSGYAIACKLGNKAGMDTIRKIRKLDESHNFSILCDSFSQLGEIVEVDNKAYRTIKALTPGPYTFILKGTKEVPRMTLNKKKHTVGVRLPDQKITRTIVEALGEPLLCSTLILPGETDPLTDPEAVTNALGNRVAAVVIGEVTSGQATTVIDVIDGYPQVVRQGAGDTSLFD